MCSDLKILHSAVCGGPNKSLIDWLAESICKGLHPIHMLGKGDLGFECTNINRDFIGLFSLFPCVDWCSGTAAAAFQI